MARIAFVALALIFASPAAFVHAADAPAFDNDLAPVVYPTGPPPGAPADNVLDLMGVKQIRVQGDTLVLPDVPLPLEEMMDLANTAKDRAQEYDRQNRQWMMDNAVHLGRETVAEILERKNVAEVTGWDDMVEYARQWVDRYREAMPGPGNKLDGNPVLYVFVSSSMPMDTLKAYSKSMEAIPGSALFVLRGLIGGMTYIKPTLEFFKSFYPELNEGDDIPAGMFIDPNLFKRYGITKVPAIVFDPAEVPGRTMTDSEIASAVRERRRPDEVALDAPRPDSEFYVVYGDVSVAYAVELINRNAKSPYLAEILAKLENSGFFSDKDRLPSDNAQQGGPRQ